MTDLPSALGGVRLVAVVLPRAEVGLFDRVIEGDHAALIQVLEFERCGENTLL